MRTLATTGIVIKRRDIGELDKIVTIFTPDHGKIVAKAKGIRKIISRRLPHIELLNHVSFSLYRVSSSSILTEIQTVNSFSEIKSDLKKIGLAYHICELIDSLCPENQEHDEVFSLLCGFLDKLSSRSAVSKAMHQFEIDLLTMLGYYSDQDLSGSKASFFIESILERKLKSRQILPHLL